MKIIDTRGIRAITIEGDNYSELLWKYCTDDRDCYLGNYGSLKDYIVNLVENSDFEDINDIEYLQQFLEEAKTNNAYFCENIESGCEIFFKFDGCVHDKEALNKYILEKILKLKIYK